MPEHAWEHFLDRRPLFANLTPDVEALLVRRGEQAGDLECFAWPIERCYALVAILRDQRPGLDGVRDARARVSALFAELRRAAEIANVLDRPATRLGRASLPHGPATWAIEAMHAILGSQTNELLDIAARRARGKIRLPDVDGRLCGGAVT